MHKWKVAHTHKQMRTSVCAHKLACFHTSIASVGKMSERREEVYLVATDLTARRGRCRRSVPIRPHLFCDAPWASWALPHASARTCTHAVLTVMCVVRDWHRTLGDASTQPDVHGMWHPAEPSRAATVTGMWRHRAAPKWLFRLHYAAKTLDVPSPRQPSPPPPVSPSWSQKKPFTDSQMDADCILPSTHCRLLARTDKANSALPMAAAATRTLSEAANQHTLSHTWHTLSLHKKLCIQNKQKCGYMHPLW